MQFHFSSIIDDNKAKILKEKIDKIFVTPMNLPEVSGYMWEKQYTPEVMEVLNWDAENIEIVPVREQEGIFILQDRRMARLLERINILDWNGSAKQSSFKNVVAESIVTQLNIPVNISVPHGRYRRYINDDKFHIYIYSSPVVDRRETSYPRELWGIRVDCRSNTVPNYAHPLGIELKDPNGHVVGNLVNNNNLYIYHDIVESDTLNEIKLFRLIIEEALKHIKPEDEYEIFRQERQAKIFSEVCARYLKKAKENALRNLEQSKERYAQLESELRSLSNQISLDTLTASMYHEENEKLLNTYKKELENIKNIKNVKGVTFSEDEVLSISTDELVCQDPRTGKWHSIGEFDINISLNGDPHNDHSISFENKTRQVNGYEDNMHAPHVFPGGNACQGNMGSQFSQLLIEQNYNALVVVCIRFLESVNIDDSAGKHINRWPELSKERIAELKKEGTII